MRIRIILGAIVLVAVLSGAAPARAAWLLDDVSVVGNPSETLTGYFDAGSTTVQDFDLAMHGFPYANWTIAGGTGAPFYLGTPGPVVGGSATVYFNETTRYNTIITLVTALANLSPQADGTIVPLIGGSNIYTGGDGGGALQGYLVEGPVPAVPLPPALSMFCLGLVGLMGYGQFKKRRPSV